MNKGSKQWQENWENHVDLLGDDIIGPLYKIVLTRPEPKAGVMERVKRIVAGPDPFSVSKINQIISLFVTMLWIFLLVVAVQPSPTMALPNGKYIAMIAVTVITCWLSCVGEEQSCTKRIKRPRKQER